MRARQHAQAMAAMQQAATGGPAPATATPSLPQLTGKLRQHILQRNEEY